MVRPTNKRSPWRPIPVFLVAALFSCTPSETKPRAASPTSTSTSTRLVVETPKRMELFDPSFVHEISMTYHAKDYDAMIATLKESGTKEWIQATVTIDARTYRNVGIRLKGNSSLMGVGGFRPPDAMFPGLGDAGPITDANLGGLLGETSATTDASSAPASTTSEPTDEFRPGNFGPGSFGVGADEPEKLPWLIRLDKYVDGQNHLGETALVVRSNSSTTALNEAVALELLGQADLATQRYTFSSFAVNDRAPVLRLAIEHPNDAWMNRTLGAGRLYKADSSGDYSYRGDDPSAYKDAWDQDGGANDLTPLIEFLRFANDTLDATFEKELPTRLDVDAFARYLAIEELFGNWDDIDGPGNNSYLYYDVAKKQMTVVAWDHNLALGVGPAGMPGGFPRDLPNGNPGFPGKKNALVDRFHQVASFEAKYTAALEQLRVGLFDSGAASSELDRMTKTLIASAANVVSPATVTEEANAIRASFPKAPKPAGSGSDTRA